MSGDVLTVTTAVADDPQYSSLAGFAFLFNVIMGNGPLALPQSFQQAGWLISIITLALLAFTSILTFTFVIEAMSITNAIFRLLIKNRRQNEANETDNGIYQIDDPLDTGITTQSLPDLDVDDFQIDRKFELGDMFKMYFGRIWNVIFYLTICVYLYGDLSIYAAGVPKSLRNVVCTATNNGTDLSDSFPCWTTSSLSRSVIYRIFVLCFAACMIPFLFFHVTRSRWLQLFTTIIRWVSFILMLSLAIDRAIVIRQNPANTTFVWSKSWNPALYDLTLTSPGDPPPKVPSPPAVRPQGIPNLFGACVYVFMCHHSIPGVVTPIRNKHRLMLRVFVPLFASVLAFNILLSGTAVAAFEKIEDFYTLNFVPEKSTTSMINVPYTLAQIFSYFLALFPVFALSSTFPILCCTLLSNLTTLFSMFESTRTQRAQRILRWTLPFVVITPPICIGLGTDDIGFLVSFTGAFAGSAIQYIFPALLVFRARRYLVYLSRHHVTSLPTYSQLDDLECVSDIGDGVHKDTQPLVQDGGCDSDVEFKSHHTGCCTRMLTNFRRYWSSSWSKLLVKFSHAAPFQHFIWIILIVLWAMFCILFFLVNKIHPI